MKKCLLGIAGMLLCTHGLWAQSFQEISQLLPTPDLSSKGHEYGESVAVDGNFAVVGAPGENAAYVLFYDGITWTEQARLAPPAVEDRDKFGFTVAIEGDVIAVGAPDRMGDGAAYVFEKQQDSWSTAQLTAQLSYDYDPNTFFGIRFGYSVNVSDGLIVVGASKEAVFLFERPSAGWQDTTQTAVLTQSSSDFISSFGRNVSVSGNTIVTCDSRIDNDLGSVYIYEKPAGGWTDATETVALSTPNRNDRNFGTSISLNNETLVVGAEGHGQSGATYVFEKPGSGWQGATYTAKLTADDERFERLGKSVQVAGSTITVGSANGGAVFLYERPISGWVSATQPTAKLTASDGKRYEDFGIPLATDGQTIVAGATELGEGGQVYLFQKPANGWASQQEDQKVVAPFATSAAGDEFGHEVDIDGNYAVVSSPEDNEVGQGAAYVFHYQNQQWIKVAKLTPSAVVERLDFASSVAISGNTIVIGTKGYGQEIDAYLYEKPTSGWQNMTESAQLSALNAGASVSYQSSVSVDGDVVAVGVNTYQTEAIYLFEKPANGWVSVAPTATLTSSADQQEDFGLSVALSGNTLVAGAPAHGERRQGMVYVFEKAATGWTDMTETAQLTVSDQRSRDDLGGAVGISGTTIVAGAVGKTFDDRTAYVFDAPATGWVDMTETARLTIQRVSGVSVGDFVDISENTIVVSATSTALVYEKPAGGWADMTQTLQISNAGNSLKAVAVSGSYVLAGAPYSNSLGTNAGTAIVYELIPNTPPTVVASVADTTITVGEVLSWTLTETFDDADGDALTYTATLSDGSALPGWLLFDASNLRFRGTPPTDAVGTMTVHVSAQDKSSEVTTDFEIVVQAAAEAEEEKETSSEEENQEEVGEEEENNEEVEEKEEEAAPHPEEEVVTGIEEDTPLSVQLFPNPSVGEMVVAASEAIQIVQVSDSQGRVIFSQTYFGSHTARFSIATPGCYHVVIQTDQGRFMKRVIVQ